MWRGPIGAWVLSGHMTSVSDNQFSFVAWSISLFLHGVVVVLAFVLVAQVRPILPEDVFQWDVALVEATNSESLPTQDQSVLNPEKPPAKIRPQLQPKRVTEASEVIRPLEQHIEPTPPPIEQKVEIPQAHDELSEQRHVEMPEPKYEPIVEAKETEPTVVTAPTQRVEALPAENEPIATPTPSQESPSEVLARETAEDAEPVQVAKVPVPGSEVKADNRWLAESLWRRVAELKRYPNSARMNGQEGKVILKAVIRSDGQLADVLVLKSSGYAALDMAAMEAVKLACPLYMKRAIGKAQIVVSLPIVYSLAN